MLYLSLDTATPPQALAITRDHDVLFEAQIRPQTKEGPGLLSLVDAALKHCQLKLEDIDRFVVSRGPGAFTGLRVSMAMLKSMALTLEKPLYAASSLEAIAKDALPSDAIVAAMIDARRGELYVAFYDTQNGQMRALSEELLLKPEDFVAYVEHAFAGKTVVCVGPAFPTYTKKLQALCDKLIIRPAVIRASALAHLVHEKYGADDAPEIPLEALEPKYIRQEDFALPKPFDFSNPGQFRHES
ncbi:MAG: tRNA (adenosine(37)-N6)-threonylcarbamoyltransferase complex dimerization subunit type 1 TsaB [Proteobacteria bacterium]|nr:tRNA (adenosine(37)-N6)-threonylcarbamoyltransferase complex dimerization subunit type 1 TsaB [Pseudomonadota bacterium]